MNNVNLPICCMSEIVITVRRLQLKWHKVGPYLIQRSGKRTKIVHFENKLFLNCNITLTLLCVAAATYESYSCYVMGNQGKV